MPRSMLRGGDATGPGPPAGGKRGVSTTVDSHSSLLSCGKEHLGSVLSGVKWV